MSIEALTKTGKTVEEAVAAALLELNVTEDLVDVEIIEVGAKGILGFGAKPAQVRVTPKHDPARAAKQFIGAVGEAMGIDIAFDAEMNEKQLQVNMSGSHMGVLIGKRGQTLDALQYLTNLIVNKGDAPYTAITLDAENYRQRRKETLESLAMNIARKVKQTRRSVKLEPMSAYERRIIHSILQADKYVSTYSEGEEPYRNVVIALKRDNDRADRYDA